MASVYYTKEIERLHWRMAFASASFRRRRNLQRKHRGKVSDYDCYKFANLIDDIWDWETKSKIVEAFQKGCKHCNSLAKAKGPSNKPQRRAVRQINFVMRDTNDLYKSRKRQ